MLLLLVSRGSERHSSAHPELALREAVSLTELFRKDSHPFPNEAERIIEMFLRDGVVSSATCPFRTRKQVSTSFPCCRAADMDVCPILTEEISYLRADGNLPGSCSHLLSSHGAYQMS